MNALALVSKFQERLGDSRANAVWRVIGFLFLSVCFVTTIALAVTFFPYTAGFTEKIPLLPGDHFQVQKILDGEVLVNRAQFLQIAKGDTTFVALGTETILYMTKVAGVSYRYDQTAPPSHSYWNYSISSQRIENGLVVREINRNTVGIIALYIIVVPLTLFLLVMFIWSTEVKGYRKVWF